MALLFPRGYDFPNDLFDVDDLFDDLRKQLATPSSTALSRPAAQRSGKRTQFLPRLDLREKDNEFHLLCELPGYEKGEVKLDVDEARHTLTLSAEQKEEKEEEKGGYHIRERRYGKVMRTVPFPQTADFKSCHATMENGVLEVKVPKLPALPGTRTLAIE